MSCLKDTHHPPTHHHHERHDEAGNTCFKMRIASSHSTPQPMGVEMAVATTGELEADAQELGTG